MKTLNKAALGFLLTVAVPLTAVSDDKNDRPMYGYGMGGGYGMGPGMMQGRGYGYGQGMMGGYYDGDYQPIPEKEAKVIIEKFIDEHLKGFKIIKIDSQRMPMGTMYWAILKDSNGNEFELHLNPFGQVRGPFVR